MVLLALASAKGSPGVTTLAVALAGLLPAPSLIADLDPAGSDLVVRFRAASGDPLDAERGLLSLGAAVRRGGLELTDHLQVISGGLPVLAGVSVPEQVTGLGPVWPHVARALCLYQGVVVADCGRVGVGSPTLPVIQEADAVVLVVRSSVEQLAHLRERLRGLQHSLRHGLHQGAHLGRRSAGAPLGVIVIAAEHERSAASDLQRLLDSGGVRAKVLGAVADDEKGARVLAGTQRGAPGRTPLVRSVRSLLPALASLVDSGGADRAGVDGVLLDGAFAGRGFADAPVLDGVRDTRALDSRALDSRALAADPLAAD